ncbi:tryptophan--tRNA ligase [Shouchella sp. 1P09AA]|uniref:tryptophan--tRNA ligase n=1 Tax=unclassified Shouchella TaxID=2893065 RepID=UPI0039A2AE1D
MNRSLTGIKPTGDIHLGNYIGAIKPALDLTKNHDAYYFVANGHALTQAHQKTSLEMLTNGVVATWLALGLDPSKSVLYRQSDIPEIFELSWVLATLSSKGLMNRAHAYKAIVDDNKRAERDLDSGVNMGLYTYPILMAADILLLQPDLVPVGRDQIQHIEMARELGLAMKRKHGISIKLPDASIIENVAVLPGLDGRKMSKSYGNTIPIFLEKDELQKRINKIKTNSLPPHEPKESATSNVFQLYQVFATADEVDAMKEAFQKGIGWGEAKAELFTVMNRTLEEPRERYKEWMSKPKEMKRLLQEGAERVRYEATPFLQNIKNEIGLG